LFGDREPDESVSAPGISAPTEIARDEFGVPHIYAKTTKDAAFAQGYMHARDRLFQIDLYRHLIEGRLSEYFGEVTFNTDIGNRTNMMTTDGRPVFEVMAETVNEDQLALLEAYAAGVNLHIARIRSGELPAPEAYTNALMPNFKPEMILDWRPADTLAIGRLQEQNLSDSTAADIARGNVKQALPADLFSDLMRYAPPDPIAILPNYYASDFNDCTSVSMCGSAKTTSTQSTKSLYEGVDFSKALHSVRLADPFGMDHMPEGVEGSNNWVVEGSLTDSGKALVLNDPHLRFYIPALFYHSHMNTSYYGGADGTSNLIGISFPGIAGVLIGYNDHVAWGATTVGWDVSDVYTETLNAAGDAVLFNGSYVPIKQVTVPIDVLLATGVETRSHVIEIVPHHGAIVPNSKANGKALTRKWTGHEPLSGVQALLERQTAKNIDDFMEAMSKFVAGAQNWNGADTSGNTGYMPGARIPVRASVTGACDPSVPMDGTGPCEWTGMIPANEIPRVKNSEIGYVVTANNDVTGTLADNDPTNDQQYLHSSNADGFRARRITDAIENLKKAGKITSAQMVELQGDTMSIEAERFMPFILTARDAEPALVTSLGVGDALTRLAAWDFSMPSGVNAEYRTDGGPSPAEVEASIAASIFACFRPRFTAAVFGKVKSQYSVEFSDTPAALYLLENPTTSKTKLTLFDDPTTTNAVETPNQVILDSLKAAVDYLTTSQGSNPDTWRWGNLHKVEIQDLFGEFGVPIRIHGPFPRGGGNSTVDVAGTGNNQEDFRYYGGPQMRFVAEVGADGISGRSSLPGGQIDDPKSPHYDDLLPLWLRNETFPYYSKEADVVAHTEELIVLVP
jgi:penicillin amidase